MLGMPQAWEFCIDVRDCYCSELECDIALEPNKRSYSEGCQKHSKELEQNS